MPIFMLLKNKNHELKTHHLIGGFAKPSNRSFYDEVNRLLFSVMNTRIDEYLIGIG